MALIEFVIGAWRGGARELSCGFSSEGPGCSGCLIRGLAGSSTAGPRGAVAVTAGEVKVNNAYYFA